MASQEGPAEPGELAGRPPKGGAPDGPRLERGGPGQDDRRVRHADGERPLDGKLVHDAPVHEASAVDLHGLKHRARHANFNWHVNVGPKPNA